MKYLSLSARPDRRPGAAVNFLAEAGDAAPEEIKHLLKHRADATAVSRAPPWTTKSFLAR